MSAGDVLIFHSLTVHKGVPNQSHQLRMSIDTRYQRVRDLFNPQNAESPFGLASTWDEVYQNWPTIEKANRLRYYWRRLDLTYKEFDSRWFDKRDKLGLPSSN